MPCPHPIASSSINHYVNTIIPAYAQTHADREWKLPPTWRVASSSSSSVCRLDNRYPYHPQQQQPISVNMKHVGSWLTEANVLQCVWRICAPTMGLSLLRCTILPARIFFNLLRLDFKHQINFKRATLTYKTLATGQPGYLLNLLNTYQPVRSLRSQFTPTSTRKAS